MAALSAAQKQQQSVHHKLNNQMQMVTKTLQSVLASNRQGKKISNGIKNLVDQIMLRQENSMISSKDADDLSLDEIDLPNSQVGIDDRDSGMIEQLNEEDCLEMQIQSWL